MFADDCVINKRIPNTESALYLSFECMFAIECMLELLGLRSLQSVASSPQTLGDGSIGLDICLIFECEMCCVFMAQTQGQR